MTPQTIARMERVEDESLICRAGLRLGRRSQAADPAYYKDPPSDREIRIAEQLLFKFARPAPKAFDAIDVATRLSDYSVREGKPGVSAGAVAIAAIRRGLAVMVLEPGFSDLAIACHVEPAPKRSLQELEDDSAFPPGNTWEFRHVVWIWTHASHLIPYAAVVGERENRR